MAPEVAPGIRVEHDGDDVEVLVAAEVDLSTEPALRRAVSAALRSRPARLTLDFCRSSFVGLSALTVAIGALHRSDARVKVRGDRRLQRMFRIGRAPADVQLEDCPDPPPATGGP